MVEGVKFIGLGIPSLLFADDVILLALSNCDLHLTMGGFQLSVTHWGGEIISLGWHGNILMSPLKELLEVVGERNVWIFLLKLLPL